MLPGVRIACDVGSVRIGIARCDPSGLLAVPLDAVAAGDGAIAAVVGLITESAAVEVVVGLPKSMSGQEGPAAERAREWADRLADATTVPIRLVDERLTTVQAQRQLHAVGRTTRTSRAIIDSASAVVLLQAYLDADRSKGAQP